MMQGIKGQTFVVFGLLNEQSIAYAIGEHLRAHGACVIYTVQNEILARRYIAPAVRKGSMRDDLDVRYCDVLDETQVATVLNEAGPLGGIVHSVAYANPKTCLGGSLHTASVEDLQQSYAISCMSLATLMKHAAPHLCAGAGLVALSFDSRASYPAYNWMGVNKAALEALVRALAREYGPRGFRANCVSAGPLATMAATKIPHFQEVQRIWEEGCPLGWDFLEDRHAVADAVVFLLSHMARRITGQTLFVDGGTSVVRGRMVQDVSE